MHLPVKQTWDLTQSRHELVIPDASSPVNDRRSSAPRSEETHSPDLRRNTTMPSRQSYFDSSRLKSVQLVLKYEDCYLTSVFNLASSQLAIRLVKA